MKYPAYPKYKASGVEWLGDVPEHWSILPFTKYVSEKSDYRGATPEKVEEGVFLVTAKNVRMGFIDYESSREFVREEDYSEIMRRGLPKKGDLLFTTEAPLGNVALVDREDIALAQRIIRFRMMPSRFEMRFTLFAMMAHYFQAQLASLSTGSTAEGLKASKLTLLWLVAPPLVEQRAIADFLDAQTAKLDMLLAKKRALIETLREQRTALISQTVTRGLPADAAHAAGFAPQLKLNPSGIEWLGDVPEHWEVKMLKRTWDLCEYGISETLSGDGPIRVLTMGNVQDGKVIFPKEGCLEEVPRTMLLKKHDLLFNRTNSLIHVGKVGLFEGEEKDQITFASYLVRIRVGQKMNPRFLAYFLNIPQLLEFARSLALPSINQANLNPTRYGQIKVVVPPLAEQRAIAEYLDAQTARIDRMIEKIEAALARLQEYRTALITAAVTGRIDVREVAK